MSQQTTDHVTDRIRGVLEQHARLATPPGTLTDGADLYQAGLTSLASVNVMLALETEFGVEFPDHMLTRAVFASIAAIRTALRQLTGG